MLAGDENARSRAHRSHGRLTIPAYQSGYPDSGIKIKGATKKIDATEQKIEEKKIYVPTVNL